MRVPPNQSTIDLSPSNQLLPYKSKRQHQSKPKKFPQQLNQDSNPHEEIFNRNKSIDDKRQKQSIRRAKPNSGIPMASSRANGASTNMHQRTHGNQQSVHAQRANPKTWPIKQYHAYCWEQYHVELKSFPTQWNLTCVLCVFYQVREKAATVLTTCGPRHGRRVRAPAPARWTDPGMSWT